MRAQAGAGLVPRGASEPLLELLTGSYRPSSRVGIWIIISSSHSFGNRVALMCLGLALVCPRAAASNVDASLAQRIQVSKSKRLGRRHFQWRLAVVLWVKSMGLSALGQEHMICHPCVVGFRTVDSALQPLAP